MNKIKTIIHKEWAEVFKNRMVLFTVAFLPLFFTALPLIILYTTGAGEVAEMEASMPEQFEAFCPPGVSGGECFQAYIVSQFMLMFMFMPLIIPVTIASYSIVGEKTNRSLEPLLATPITTAELLIGKSLAAAIPAVVATDAAFGLFALGAWMLTPNPILLRALLDARWLLAVFVVGPLMALTAISVSIMVSSRVNDPRVAEQVSMVVMVPLLAVFFGQIAGLFVINRQMVFIAALALLVIDAVLVWLAMRVFEREAILTRWK